MPKPHHPPGAGKSSFHLIDPEKLFAALDLKPGDTVMDLGCGEGNYTLPLARGVGEAGVVYALDLWEPGLATLRERAAKERLTNIRVIPGDVSQPLKLPTPRVDLVFMATVLHDLAEAGLAAPALTATARLVKPGGRLAVVEFQKIPGPPGPPLHIRLAPEETAGLVQPHGFRLEKLLEPGPDIYLMLFTKT